MQGGQQLVINALDIISRGMSSGAEIADGAFSPETKAINPLRVPGSIQAPAALVNGDSDSILTGEIIATSPDMASYLGTDYLVVADNGTFYRYNGTKLVIMATTDGVNTYAKGFTEMIIFGGDAYITAKQGITRWQNDNTITAPSGSWAFTNTIFPHPAIVFENNAFYGDKNLLLRQSTPGVAPTVIMTLDSNQVIVALGIDPVSGKMLISTTYSLDVSNTLPSIAKLLWYDGFSNKPSKAVIVDDTILGFYAVGGTVFVGYGQNLGYVNGAGVTFLRKLANTTLDQDYLPSKHNFANLGKILLVADGTKVLAFGEVISGRKIFFYIANNFINSGKFRSICYVGDGKIGLSFDTTKFYTLNTTSIASIDASGFDFWTNWIEFPRPVLLRSMELEFIETTSLVVSGNYTITYYGQDLMNKGLTPERAVFTSESGPILGFLSEKTTRIKLNLSNGLTNKGLKRIIIYYDYAE